MLPQQKRKSTSKKRRGRGPTKFPGISEDAKALGVNRATLWKMLNGKPGFGDLEKLKERYTALKKEQKGMPE